MSDPPADPYRTLQVVPEADDEVISAAYRRLARKYHPDVSPGGEAAARMAAINAAWELIGEPSRRAAFDRQRALEAAIRRRNAETGPAATGAQGSSAGADEIPGARTDRPAETVSRDWTSGRSSTGGGYAPSMRTADGEGAAGQPPGEPSGSVITFGRYTGWSLGEIARTDLEYLEWLDRMTIGRPYRDEIDAILRRTGRRRSADADAADRRGLFRRR